MSETIMDSYIRVINMPYFWVLVLVLFTLFAIIFAVVGVSKLKKLLMTQMKGKEPEMLCVIKLLRLFLYTCCFYRLLFQ